MNKQERPRERALMQGMHVLSNRELLAILLRSGTREHSVLDLADQILHTKQDLTSLMELTLQDLMQIPGIKEAKASQLLACFELCQRISLDRLHQEMETDQNPEVLCDWLMHLIGSEPQEHFMVLFLNNRGKMIAHKDLFIGTGTQSFANPREVFLNALQSGCNKIICAHNHPSQNVEPSSSDVLSAHVLEESGDMIGIKVVDHLIVSQRNYYSFMEHEKMLYQMHKDCEDSEEEPLSDVLFPNV